MEIEIGAAGAADREAKVQWRNDRVRYYVDNAIAPSTRAAYDRNWRLWEKYCAEEEPGQRPIPGEVDTVARFLVDRAEKASSAKVADTAIAAIKERHQAQGLASPTDDVRIHRMMKGLHKEFDKTPKQAKPMETEDMKKLMAFHLQERAGRSNEEKLIAWRTLFRMRLCHAGLLRFSEVMKLVRGDISFGVSPKSGQEYMEVRVRKSKTDQLGRGASKIYPAAEDKSICPVTLGRKYLAAIKNDPKCPLQQHVQLVRGTNLAKYTGGNIDRPTADKDRMKLLEQAGFNPKEYTEHSGRRGGAVGIMEAGGSTDDLMRAGRWASRTMPEHYAKGAVERSIKVARMIDE